MTTAIGLDLGNGLTKIAQRQPFGAKVIPTAVTYQGLSTEIPAPTRFPRPDDREHTVRCDGFPAMLGYGEARPVPSFGDRTSGEVTQEFVRLLFESLGWFAGDTQAPGPFVVSVPAVRGDHGGAEPDPRASAKLRGIFASVGYKPRGFIASPIATVLYLREREPELAPVTRFVVCDAGVAAITLSLCAVERARVRLVDCTRIVAASQWDADANWRDDRAPNLIESLVRAIAPTEARAGISAREVVRRWRAFEQALANVDQRESMEAALEQASKAPRRYGGTIALRIDGADITAAALLRGCLPLADRCGAELADLMRRQRDGRWRDPASSATSKIVLSGGLLALPPLRTAMLGAVGLDPDQRDGRCVALNPTEQIAAPAYGAALIAAGQADPGDRYPHGLRLLAHRRVRDHIEDYSLELAVPGTVDANATEPTFLRDSHGQPALVKVGAVASPDPSRPIPVQVVRGDHTEPAIFHPAPPPQPGTYQVGVIGDQDGAAIVLEPADGGERLRYVLAGEPAGGRVSEPDEAARRPRHQKAARDGQAPAEKE